MLVISGFAIAGLFSSRVILASNFVLISGDSCTIWNYNLTGQASHLNTSSMNSTTDLANQACYVYGKDLALSSLHYARSCYIGGVEGDTGSGTCDYYPAMAINWMTGSGPCPFDPSLCIEPGNGSLVLETALDSSKDLGLNTKLEDRITYHRRVACSVLNTTRYHNSCVNVTNAWGTDCETNYTLSSDLASAIISSDPAGTTITTTVGSSELQNLLWRWEMPYILG